MCTGERQSSRIRAKYLRAILRQDVAYFDSESSRTAVVVNNVSADSLLVQEAMSEKVGLSEPPPSQFGNRRKNPDGKKDDSGEEVIIVAVDVSSGVVMCIRFLTICGSENLVQ